MIEKFANLTVKLIILPGLSIALLACSPSGPPSEADVKSRFTGDPADVKVVSIATSPGGEGGCSTKDTGLQHRDEYPALVVYKQDLGQCGGIRNMPGVNCGEKFLRGYFCMWREGGKWLSNPGFGG